MLTIAKLNATALPALNDNAPIVQQPKLLAHASGTNGLIIVSMLTAVLCAGCEVGMHVESKPAENPTDEATKRGMSGYMEEIRLKDGTRCVTWKSGYGGGLSCDWKHGA